MTSCDGHSTTSHIFSTRRTSSDGRRTTSTARTSDYSHRQRTSCTASSGPGTKKNRTSVARRASTRAERKLATHTSSATIRSLHNNDTTRGISASTRRQRHCATSYLLTNATCNHNIAALTGRCTTAVTRSDGHSTTSLAGSTRCTRSQRRSTTSSTYTTADRHRQHSTSATKRRARAEKNSTRVA
jgi:hypothetical protein